MISIAPITGDGIATIIAALVGAGIVVAGFLHDRRSRSRSRRAEAYAGALQAVSDYLEAPYRIRRRTGSPEDRFTLTTHVSEIQSRLDFYIALLTLIAVANVRDAYVGLVIEAKSEAGPQMTKAWRSRPTRRDRGVPMANAYQHPRSDEARKCALTAMNHNP
jgi:hypothetical protein